VVVAVEQKISVVAETGAPVEVDLEIRSPQEERAEQDRPAKALMEELETIRSQTRTASVAVVVVQAHLGAMQREVELEPVELVFRAILPEH
jgi:hypothetical protein